MTLSPAALPVTMMVDILGISNPPLSNLGNNSCRHVWDILLPALRVIFHFLSYLLRNGSVKRNSLFLLRSLLQQSPHRTMPLGKRIR